jgi:hypothetical protein
MTWHGMRHIVAQQKVRPRGKEGCTYRCEKQRQPRTVVDDVVHRSSAVQRTHVVMTTCVLTVITSVTCLFHLCASPVLL